MSDSGGGGGFWANVKTIVYAVLFALIFRTFLYEPFNIPSGSMLPTLLVGDFLFVSKASYGYSRYSLPFSPPIIPDRLLFDEPDRGDIVVFKLPADNRTDYIKRIIGLPGDRIQVRQGRLYINDTMVERRPAGTFLVEGEGLRPERLEQYVETLPNGVEHLILERSDMERVDNTGVFQVPPGYYFAMGDNRDNSLDSRASEVGFIPAVNLVGRAEFLFFSIDWDADELLGLGRIRWDRFFEPVSP